MQSIIHVALVVRDYDEAIEFYTKTLDFTLVEDTYQPAQDKRWVPSRCSRTCMGISGTSCS
jgi:catechol 2,3-dioxygenase-like lactoylglutathione lyase family enzyme